MTTLQVYKPYYDEILSTLSYSHRAFLDSNIKANYYYLIFKNGSPIAGFTTRTDGYLTGLFSLVPNFGTTLVSLRLEQAKKDATNDKLTLFCIGERVRDLYLDLGFTVTDTQKWDDSKANLGWDYEKFGRPNLYNLELCI